MPRPIHLEIVADDPGKSADFFTKVFDWKVQRWDGDEEYWLVQTGEGEPGIDGAIMRRQERWQYPVAVIGVPSVDDYLARIEEAGGKLISPKNEIPGVGFAAYFEDPAGNYFGIFEAAERS